METSGFTKPPARSLAIYRWLMWVSAILTVILLWVAFMQPSPGGIKRGPESACVQASHALGLALYSCAIDNNQQYPEGTSSTEVFQKLIDGGYVTDPVIFYIPMPGKERPLPGQKLKPKNVCWDVTTPADFSSPEGLPLIFMTGYKVNYVPGGAATPLSMPSPQYGFERKPNWYEQMLGISTVEYPHFDGIAVFYKMNLASFATTRNAPDGTIPNFIPSDFKPDGKTYRQLTPDGVLK